MNRRAIALLGRLVALLPGEERVWGQALLGELDAVPEAMRTRWALGLVPLLATRVSRRLRPQRPDRDAGTRVALVTGLTAGAAIAADLAYSNLGPASRHPMGDPLAPTLAAYALLFGMFVAIGFVHRGSSRSVADCARASGMSAAVIILIAFTTTLVIDNFWLSVVARQPDKISGLTQTPLFHSMRAYLNGQQIIGLIVVLPTGVAVAGLCGILGARLRRRSSPWPLRALEDRSGR